MSQATGSRLQLWGLCGALLGLLVLASPAGAESRRERMAALERLNERWSGAQCRLKTHWKIRKRSDEGWYKSSFVETSSDQFKRIILRVKVRDRQALARRIRNDNLLAGTSFECLGFRFREEKNLNDLYLAMRSANEGVETELLVWTGQWMSKPDLKALPGIERFLRLHIIDMKPRSEQLTAVAGQSDRSTSDEQRALAAAFFSGEPLPPPPSAPPVRSPASSPSQPPAGGDTVFRPAVEILAVSVQPPQIRAGGQVELVVNYTVSGLPPGAQFAVTETRSLSLGERTLTSSSAETSRANGTFTSSLEAPIPAAATAGIYRLTVEVAVPGTDPASGSALFEVVP